MLLRTGLNVVLPTLFKVVNNVEQHCCTYNSASTTLFNVVNNCEQYEQWCNRGMSGCQVMGGGGGVLEGPKQKLDSTYYYL